MTTIMKRAKPELKKVPQYTSLREVPRDDRPGYFDPIESYLPAPSCMGRFEGKRDDFGFVDGVFVHISNARYPKSALPKTGYIIGKIVDTRKGKQLVDYVLEGDKEFQQLYQERYAEAEKVFLDKLNERLSYIHQRDYEAEMREYERQMEIQNELGFHSIVESHEVFDKAYMDSKFSTTFTLSREVSRFEFSDFLKLVGLKEKFQEAWYEDYTVLSGEGDTWTYTRISPSTH